MTLAARLLNLAAMTSVPGDANLATRLRRRDSMLSWAKRNVLLPAGPAAAAVLALLVVALSPGTHLPLLLAAVALSVSSCAAAWIV